MRNKFKSIVCIGKNGVGKSKYLESLANQQGKNIFLVNFSSSQNAPDNYEKKINKTEFVQKFTD